MAGLGVLWDSAVKTAALAGKAPAAEAPQLEVAPLRTVGKPV